IITNSDELAQKYRILRDHGRISKFNHAVVGRNSRLDGIQAAVLEVKLRHLNDWITARQENAEYYNEFLGEWVMLPEWRDTSARYTYHQYPVLAPQRDRLLSHLHGRGIEAGKHYPFALPNLAPYKQYSKGDYIIAQLIADNEISLPIHEMLSCNDLNAVILAVESFYERF
ncbi:MAG: DegT/DnrJ/EryC1/StrS family aminotransferase, partial [Gammaproteobacteria bacterium]|nr:DegT/DnrJ/EryC1/StrS family aminotransferase [Gammaproteobacteria bacterium]